MCDYTFIARAALVLSFCSLSFSPSPFINQQHYTLEAVSLSHAPSPFNPSCPTGLSPSFTLFTHGTLVLCYNHSGISDKPTGAEREMHMQWK